MRMALTDSWFHAKICWNCFALYRTCNKSHKLHRERPAPLVYIQCPPPPPTVSVVSRSSHASLCSGCHALVVPTTRRPQREAYALQSAVLGALNGKWCARRGEIITYAAQWEEVCIAPCCQRRAVFV